MRLHLLRGRSRGFRSSPRFRPPVEGRLVQHAIRVERASRVSFSSTDETPHIYPLTLRSPVHYHRCRCCILDSPSTEAGCFFAYYRADEAALHKHLKEAHRFTEVEATSHVRHVQDVYIAWCAEHHMVRRPLYRSHALLTIGLLIGLLISRFLTRS